MSRAIRARIDRSALKHNLARARQAAPGSRVMAVVKGDAYGHGMVPTAQSLMTADAFGVEDLGAAVRLREAGIRQEIVLLSGFHTRRDLDGLGRRRFCPVLHHRWQIDTLQGMRRSLVTRVWVKIDTGMHRLGFLPSEVPEILQTLKDLSHVQIAGLMSHLASSDDSDHDAVTRGQYELFKRVAGKTSFPLSLANSPAVLTWPETHLDWIRPGMMLYGCSPIAGRSETDLDLRPAMILEAQIIATKTIPAGEGVGYGGTWRCETETRVGAVACGYGDGYPRHAPSGTPVWVKGRRSQILGRVSMDLITIDLSACEDAEVGDWVELWGTHVPASEVATRAGTIPYQLVTGVTARVPRIYSSWTYR